MVARVSTVAFRGIETLDVDVQVSLTRGGDFPGVSIVGLADKAVAESRERVRAALSAIGLALPPKRIIVNLSPADLAKEGSHYDLPIALALLVAIGALSAEDLAGWVALGELALDGRITPVSGVLPTAIEAAGRADRRGVICPDECGPEARWSEDIEVITAMNPCRCGHLADPERACARAPRCGQDYQSKISGPLLDRFDVTIEVQAVSALDLSRPPPSETSADVAARVARAREVQALRYRSLGGAGSGSRLALTNAEVDGEILERVAEPDAPGRELLRRAAEQLRMSARGYHRALRVARTLADLDGADTVTRAHIAEAIAWRTAAAAARPDDDRLRVVR